MTETLKRSRPGAPRGLAGVAGRDRAVTRPETSPRAWRSSTGSARPLRSANHHPDVTLTYPPVHIRLSSHDVGGVTERDIELARADQRHRRRAGRRPPTPRRQPLELAPRRPRRPEIKPFWAAVLGYDDSPTTTIVDPQGARSRSGSSRPTGTTSPASASTSTSGAARAGAGAHGRRPRGRRHAGLRRAAPGVLGACRP